MKSVYVWVMVLGLGCVAGATGCKRAAQALTKASEEHAAEQAQQEVAENPAHVAVGHYNKGFNLLIEDPQDVLDEYYGKIPEEGPEPGEKYALTAKHSLATSDIAEIKKAFADGEKAAPASIKHLGPLATSCVGDIEKVLEAFKSAHEYWQGEQAKADKGAKGKTLHADFVKVADAYRESVKKFEDALSVIEDQQMTEELKAYESTKSYGYWFRLHNQQANKLLKADKDTFAAPFAEVEKAHAGLTAFVAGKPDAHAVFKTYLTQADNFSAAGKKLKAAYEDKKRKPDDISDARSSAIDAYNAMIEVSNSLRELEGNNLLK